MKKLSVELKLENPCSEDWELMTPVSQGRFCNSCQKTVVDMTTWTERDFVAYFNLNREKVCGRFYEHQLNRRFDDHELAQRRKPSYERALALIISFFTLHAASAQEKGQPAMSQEILTGAKPDAIKIRGTITDGVSMPLANVLIGFNGKSYQSDSSGHYEILLASGEVKAGTITFSYEGLTPEVRSYHLTMQSTSYDIQMLKPSGGRIMGGAPISRFYWPGGDQNNYVSVAGKALDSATMRTLAGFAAVLQSNPSFEIELQSYFSRDPKQSVGRALLVKEYLVEKLGIDEARLLMVGPKRSRSTAEKYKVYFLPRDSW